MMGKVFRGGFWVGVGLLFAFAFWLRVTSLETMPLPDSDEVWFTQQILQAVNGQTFEMMTPSGNATILVQAPVIAPLLLIGRPALWMIRAASVIAGLLSVLLTYQLGRRVLDRTTAVIAAAVVAALPFAIVQGRTGYDCSQTPLYSILLFYFAFRVHLVGAGLLLIVNYLVHPTNIFITPCVCAVFLGRSLEIDRHAGREPRWRRILSGLAILVCIGLGLGLHKMHQPQTRSACEAYHLGLGGEHLPGRFLVSLTRTLMASRTLPVAGGVEIPQLLHNVLFGAVVVGLLVFGSPRLIRARQWDRVALIGGLLISMLGLFVVGGSSILNPPMGRYAWFLVVPMALALGCLARSFIIPRQDGSRTLARSAQLMALLAAGWLLLLSLDLHAIGRAKNMDPYLDNAERKESLWTLRTEDVNPYKKVLRIVSADPAAGKAGGGEARRAIFCEDWWTYNVTKFLVNGRDNLDVFLINDGIHNQLMLDRLEAGAYFVVLPGRGYDAFFERVGEVQRRDIRRHGERYLSIYQFSYEARKMFRPVVGDYDGDGRDDVAVFRPLGAAWQLSRSSDGEISECFGDVHAIPAPGDYDGDGRADIAFYQPRYAQWFLRPKVGSSDARCLGTLGESNSLPVPGDYDGDGKTDAAVYSPATSSWSLLQSTSGLTSLSFGWSHNDVPVPADYDGDGRTDLAVYRPNGDCVSGVGIWEIRTAANGIKRVSHGGSSLDPGCDNTLDIPVPADYDGDGQADPAIFRASSATWYLLQSKAGAAKTAFGMPGGHAMPVPGDYDGDGRADLALFSAQDGMWTAQLSTGGLLVRSGVGQAARVAATPAAKRNTTR